MNLIASPIKRAVDMPLYGRISKNIHPADEMFLTGKKSLPKLGEASNHYFYGGAFVAKSLADFLTSEGVNPAQSSILDFGAGYGRVTRYLVHIFKNVSVMDLEPEMLAFNRSEFGADGYLSHTSIERAEWPSAPFDVVFSFSVFTHLHPSIWAAWFERVLECVKIGGYLIVTTRGVEFHAAKGGVMNGDFDYVERNENPNRLDTSIYGQMTVSREFIERQIAHLKGRISYVAKIKGGDFDLYQEANIFKRLA